MCVHFLFSTFKQCHHTEHIMPDGKSFVPARKCRPVRAAIDWYHTQPNRSPEMWPYPYPQVCPPVWGTVDCAGNVAGLLHPARLKCYNCERLEHISVLVMSFRDSLRSGQQIQWGGTPANELAFSDGNADLTGVVTPRYADDDQAYGTGPERKFSKTTASQRTHHGIRLLQKDRSNDFESYHGSTNLAWVELRNQRAAEDVHDRPDLFNNDPLQKLMKMIWEPGWFWDESIYCYHWFLASFVCVHGSSLGPNEIEVAEKFIEYTESWTQVRNFPSESTTQQPDRLAIESDFTRIDDRASSDVPGDNIQRAWSHRDARTSLTPTEAEHSQSNSVGSMFENPRNSEDVSHSAEAHFSETYSKNHDTYKPRRTKSLPGNIKVRSASACELQSWDIDDRDQSSQSAGSAAHLEAEVRKITEAETEQWRVPRASCELKLQVRRASCSISTSDVQESLHTLLTSGPRDVEDSSHSAESPSNPARRPRAKAGRARLASTGRIPQPELPNRKSKNKRTSSTKADPSNGSAAKNLQGRDYVHADARCNHTRGRARPPSISVLFVPPVLHNRAKYNADRIGVAWQQFVAVEYTRQNICGACEGALNPNPPIPPA